jgi:hypothetical protein
VHNIYSLTDPRTKKVFYVGATRQKLYRRLSQHCSESGRFIVSDDSVWGKKMALIVELREAGLKPIISILEETDNPISREQYHYEKLISEGATLLQSPRQLGIIPV